MNDNKPLQTKTIAKVCQAKIKQWAKSVESNKEIADIINNNTIITGGALVSLLSGEPVNDYDIYFRTKEAALKVANFYVEKFKEENKSWISSKIPEFEARELPDRIKIFIKSAGCVAVDNNEDQSATEYQYFEGTRGNEAEEFLQSLASRATKKGQNYAPVFMSDNAITLSNDIQIVIRFFGEPETIHKNYDFVHCTNYYTSWDNKVVLNMDAMESIRTKTLRYVGSLYPICSILRLRKFIARGWKINAGQVLKIIWQIKDLNLHDYDILKEQLVGVDAAYFSELLAMLKPDIDNGKSIDQSYITNLIDLVFDK